MALRAAAPLALPSQGPAASSALCKRTPPPLFGHTRRGEVGPMHPSTYHPGTWLSCHTEVHKGPPWFPSSLNHTSTD